MSKRKQGLLYKVESLRDDIAFRWRPHGQFKNKAKAIACAVGVRMDGFTKVYVRKYKGVRFVSNVDIGV